jgi:predicted dehydrogenase
MQALSQAAKLLRFMAIYGPGRTFFKAAGRMRLPIALPSLQRRRNDIGIVGCGQFAYATLGYFLRREFGRCVRTCFDIDAAAQASLARALSVPGCPTSFEQLLDDPGLKTLYIASNHASHASYAVQALQRGIDVYVEKPVAVRRDQLVELLRAARHSRAQLWAGYNRPFSGAIRTLREQMPIDPGGGITLQCFVSGHRIAPDHWYRRPEEGTRICGNVGHWLDLMVHVFAWRGLPKRLDISLTCADALEPDDNLSITIASDRGDLFSVLLTSRNEPFEGINETICVQHGETTCKIDDFRRLTLWRGTQLLRRHYWPKDVGHRLAILQPFEDHIVRDWYEVELSTLLMLHVVEMVRDGRRHSTFSLQDSHAALTRDIETP